MARDMIAETFDVLLYLYDWEIRAVAEVQKKNQPEDYVCGYADAIGQCILDLGKLHGEQPLSGPYKFEAYKRVCNFTSAADYVKQYPKEIKRPEVE